MRNNEQGGLFPVPRSVFLVPLSASLVVLLISACASSQPTPTLEPPPSPTAQSTPTLEPPLSSTAQPTPTPPGPPTVQVISTDLSLGPNRLAFAVLRDGNTVSLPEVTVASVFPAEGSSGTVRQTASARFRKWPFGDIGVYTTQLDFDQAGTWGLVVDVPRSSGPSERALVELSIKERSDTPAMGSQAPLSKNKTAGDVNSLEELTTARTPDPDLYQMTIAQAISTGKPLVVTFSTPAFCTTATCGPQVEELSALKDLYAGRANFIHVEIFDNPHKIQGDLSAAKTVAAAEEWGLPTEPWTFIVDQRGRVAAKFEAFTTGSEIEEALVRLLQ